ncbi:hypothetical protein PENPOL_c008G08886 [Penicillium polonicum]|uniref:Uncharacterized protein n=1 Tax=Penicillium polonicum TaxID=60169 RepID=A0A1V6NH52_PENPO|nr:hypothetical protein PENPOL_c008G08886 [Penicillium polonicum]
MDTQALADVLKPCSFNWADDAEEAFGTLNSVTQPNNHCTTIHPITRAIVQAIPEADGDEIMETFSYQKMAVFKPSLPAIEEKYTPSQTYSAYSLVKSLGRADNSEGIFHVHHTAHPTTLAIARAISEGDEEDMMTIFRCQRIPLFEPSLPAIEEEGYHTPSQPSSDRSLMDVLGKADNLEIVFRSSQRLRRTTTARDLRGQTAGKNMAIPRAQYNLSMAQLSILKASPLSSLITPDYEASHAYSKFSQLSRERKRDKLKKIAKQVFRKLDNLQGASWNYVGQTVWVLC